MQAHKENVSCDHKFSSMDKDDAIEQLMTQYGEEIKRLIYTYTKNWAQADDLTQDVFVQIYMKLDQFTGKSAIRTWIYSIAINRCKDFKKSWHFKNMQLFEKVISFTKADNRTPEVEAIQKDDDNFLMDKVMSLPIKYREVILLFYYKEFSVEEISVVTGINQGTVKTRLKRAREKLHTLYMGTRGETIE
ncbi:sigma-70 family RNA polymerase sigma factor [Anaerobacillus alkaliphilus]|uniref:RNA polymerase sigma factor n=1 Tax=Anaerobacillus alkaliphilus TaxID=1548597 RepID=A0A4Q0VQA3_9BACI|nr:sigma-70 family RNA polymerase sigma factor [Anaerobacillus alkaliphilus]RXI98603.1 sigma-70 family RNA polymerase sigma factor [Anaerobacillus alkaliphilus]